MRDRHDRTGGSAGTHGGPVSTTPDGRSSARPIGAARIAGEAESVFAVTSRRAIAAGAINLGQGFPDFDGPREMIDAAVSAMRTGRNQYAPSAGVPDLRAAIVADVERRQFVSRDADDEVTVTSGCTEALAASILGLIDPGDEVILFEPWYDAYPSLVRLAGGTPVSVTMTPPAFAIDGDALRAAITPRTRAILVNTPHNPSGRVLDDAELETIASVCREHDLLCLSDEVYERLVFDGTHRSIATVSGMRERTVVLSSLGKTYSATGWKIGWAIAPPAHTHALRMAHQALVFSAVTPMQDAGAIALDTLHGAYDRELVSMYVAKRDRLVDGLRSVGFEVEAPQGTYFVLADHTPFGFADDRAFCDHLLDEVGVAAIPTSFFHDARDEGPRGGSTHVRFAFCKDERVLDAAIDRMRALRPSGGGEAGR